MSGTPNETRAPWDYPELRVNDRGIPESVADVPLTRYAAKVGIMCDFGDELAVLSTDPRIEVGCVVFPVDCSAVAGIGYNGAAEGLAHDSIDTSGKLGTGQSGAAHAEANALLKMERHGPPCLLYTTHEPCAYCAPLVVNSRRVVGVIVREDLADVDGRGLAIVAAAGIPVVSRKAVGLVAAGRAEDPAVGLRDACVVRWWRSLRPERPRFDTGGRP